MSRKKAKKNTMLGAYVRWFFLGLLGSHRYYMGKRKSAALMTAITGLYLLAVLLLLLSTIFFVLFGFSYAVTAMQQGIYAIYNAVPWLVLGVLSIMVLWWLCDTVVIYLHYKGRKEKQSQSVN